MGLRCVQRYDAGTETSRAAPAVDDLHQAALDAILLIWDKRLMGTMDLGRIGATVRAAVFALTVAFLCAAAVAAEEDWATDMNAGQAALESLDFFAARDAFARALEASKGFGGNDPRRRSTLNKLAAAYNGLGAYDRSEPLLREALDLWEKTAQPGDLELASTLHNLAGVLYARGNYGKARPYLKWALAIREKLLPAQHPAIEHTKHSIDILNLVATGDPGGAGAAEGATAAGTAAPEIAPKPAPELKAAQAGTPKSAPAAQETAEQGAASQETAAQETIRAEAAVPAAKADPPRPAPEPEPKPVAKAADPKPAAAPAQPKAEAQPAKAPAKTAPDAPATQSAKAVDGDFLAHLASYKSPEKANAGWVDLQRAFPDQLGQRSPVLRRVDLGDKGIFHRLLVGGLASSAEAKALCDQLKAKKQYCAVMRR